ncbi:MAG: dTDP-4-dehydrorhamnose 3,5-epimerase [Pseudomonadota bacterium]
MCALIVEETPLPGVLIVQPKVHGDHRGFFMETYNSAAFESAGLPDTFVQDNHSRSSKGVLRGLHYQYPQWQGKLVRVIAGEIFDVAVDIRKDSLTFGQWFGMHLNDKDHRQLYVPPGFAHGFCVTSDIADVVYKCTALYKSDDDAGIKWNDPEIGVKWPVADPEISEKDDKAPLLAEVGGL